MDDTEPQTREERLNPLLSESRPDDRLESIETVHSWLILVLIFVGVVTIYGLSTTVGVFHVIFLEEFGESNAVTAWIGSINTATTMFSGKHNR